MPLSRRPTRTATRAWPASWTTVMPSRTCGQAVHEQQREAPVASTNDGSGTGCRVETRSQAASITDA